jgi:hypothetical protein
VTTRIMVSKRKNRNEREEDITRYSYDWMFSFSLQYVPKKKY